MTRQVDPELLERRLADVTEAAVAGLGLPTATESNLPLVDATGGLAYQQLATGGLADDAVTPAKIQQGTAGQVLMSNATPDTAWTTLSGDVTVSATGVTAIGAGVVVNADVATGAAIALSKLASVTAGSVVLGNASNVATATALTGDVTVNSSGVTAIGSGVVVDADIAAGAAITLSKLASVTAGSVVLGNASNVATATALTGDVTVTSSGVTAIAAGAVVNADLATSTGELGGAWNSDAQITGFTNVTGGTFQRRWLQVGKTLHFRGWFQAGTATALGSVAFTLPGGFTAITGRNQLMLAVNTATIVTAVATNATGTVTLYSSNAGGTFAAGAALTNLTVQGTIQIT